MRSVQLRCPPPEATRNDTAPALSILTRSTPSQNFATFVNLIAVSTSANIVHLFHCLQEPLDPLQCLKIFKIGQDPPGSANSRSIVSVRLVEACDDNEIHLWCATVLGRVWRIPLAITYIGDSPKPRITLLNSLQNDHKIAANDHICRITSSTFCLFKGPCGLLGMELDVLHRGRQVGCLYGLLQPPTFLRFGGDGVATVSNKYEEEREIDAALVRLLPEDTLKYIEAYRNCNDQASYPAAVVGSRCGGLKLLLCGPECVVKVHELCKTPCGSRLVYINVVGKVLVAVSDSSVLVVLDLSSKGRVPSILKFQSPCRTVVLHAKSTLLRIYGSGAYRDYSIDTKRVSIELLEKQSYAGIIVSSCAIVNLLVTVTNDGLVSVESCEQQESGCLPQDVYPSLKRELKRLAKSVESTQDLAAEDRSLDKLIRASLLMDSVLTSVKAVAVPLVSSSLRFPYRLGADGFDMSQEQAGLTIKLSFHRKEKLSTQSLRVLSDCSFQISIAFTYRASQATQAEVGTLTLSNEKFDFHNVDDVWSKRVGVGIRSPLATIKISLNIRASSSTVPLQMKWRHIDFSPEQFSTCDFLTKAQVCSRYDSPYLAKKRVVAQVLSQAMPKRTTQKASLLLPMMGMFGPREDQAELLLGSGYEARWEVTQNAMSLVATAYTCYGVRVTVKVDKLLHFGHFEQEVIVESDCMETTGAMKLHLYENFLKKLRKAAPRKLGTISTTIYGLSKHVPKLNTQLEQLEHRFPTLHRASDDFNPVETVATLEQIQGIYEDFVTLSTGNLASH